MTNFQALILGIVQGLTEYLPVSSSAHLVIVPGFFGWKFSVKTAFIFDVLVQLGTLFGVMIYFRAVIFKVIISVLGGIKRRKLLHDKYAQMGWFVVVATIPAVIFGFSFKGKIENYFSSPRFACFFLIMTGLMIILGERFNRTYKEPKQFPFVSDAIIMGIAQSLALLPGVSRSGSTIAFGMMNGLSRRSAAQFSFLMSIPIMLGASFVAINDLLADLVLIKEMISPLILGTIGAAISGYLVIKWFMNYLKNQNLFGFSMYCLAIGLFGILYFS